ncbi:MAG: hypothetical protein SFW67_15660 [Myxococcaceae bacterium]|nr:hypothetical protein [Myxococcaceae bacterium]
MIARLAELYDAFEYDELLGLADVVLERADLELTQRLEVYRFQASVKAVTKDIVEAEKPFRLLLRANPAYELPPQTPPKIMAVFRKVQVEEQALARGLRQVERARLIGRLKLTSPLPTGATGGRPLPFLLTFRDEGSVIVGVRLGYRRAGDGAFSSLALTKTAAGWEGTLPAELTASEKGFTLEYVIETFDDEGPLLQVGSLESPRPLLIAAGAVEKKRFAPVPRSVFFGAVGTTAVAGLTATGFAVAFSVLQAQYRSTVAMATDLDGAQLSLQRSQGAFAAVGTNVSLLVLAVLAAATVVLATLTNFE